MLKWNGYIWLKAKYKLANFINITNSLALYQMKAKNFYQKKFIPVKEGNAGFWITQVSGEHSVKGIEEQIQWQKSTWQGSFSFRWLAPDKEVFNQQRFIADVP